MVKANTNDVLSPIVFKTLNCDGKNIIWSANSVKEVIDWFESDDFDGPDGEDIVWASDVLGNPHMNFLNYTMAVKGNYSQTFLAFIDYLRSCFPEVSSEVANPAPFIGKINGLEPISKEDLIYSCEDCICTEVQFSDYDWADYQFSTAFETKNNGKIRIIWEYILTDGTFAYVEQFKDGIYHLYNIRLDAAFAQDLFVMYMNEHLKQWNNHMAFDGDDIVIEFFNGTLKFATDYCKFRACREYKDIREIGRNMGWPLFGGTQELAEFERLLLVEENWKKR